MFNFWGSKDQPSQPRPQEVSTQSWYPPSVVSSSRPSTPGTASSGNLSIQKPFERSQSSSHISPAEAAAITNLLKEKSVDELRNLLSDKDAYNHLLLSVEQVKTQNNVRDELRKETVQLAKGNIEKEGRIMELKNQCRIIRTTELAAAEEKLNELDKQKQEILNLYSPISLLRRLHESMTRVEDESERLLKAMGEREMDVAVFVSKYKRLRATYHKRALTHLAAKAAYG